MVKWLRKKRRKSELFVSWKLDTSLEGFPKLPSIPLWITGPSWFQKAWELPGGQRTRWESTWESKEAGGSWPSLEAARTQPPAPPQSSSPSPSDPPLRSSLHELSIQPLWSIHASQPLHSWCPLTTQSPSTPRSPYTGGILWPRRVHPHLAALTLVVFFAWDVPCSHLSMISSFLPFQTQLKIATPQKHRLGLS